MKGAFLFALLCAVCFAVVTCHPIGGELGERPGAFIDVVKESSTWTTSSGDAVPVDASGWPMADAQTLLFDNRPYGAWLTPPTLDDPLGIAPDDSGVYHFTFNGKATVGGYTFSGMTSTFDAASYTTTGNFSVSNKINFVVLSFTNTQRSANSAANSGITNLRVVRPGYALGDDTTKIFTDTFLAAHAPFAHLRYMDWRDTNYDVSTYGSPLGSTFEWTTRRLPSDAHQSSDDLRAGTQGVAWEYIILLANKLNQNVWINVPVQATGSSATDTTSYVYQLATLFKNGNAATGNKGLNSNLNIYIEHSNEVWNSGFTQYGYNKRQAVNEVNANPNSNLNVPPPGTNAGTSEADIWAQRLHIRRVMEIGQIFSAVFGSSTRIKPIYAHFTIEDFQYQNNLVWFNSTFGDPNKFIWGVAQTKYYDDGNSDGTPDEVVTALNSSSYDSSNRAHTIAINAIAKSWGLQHTSYEGGAGVASQTDSNVANRITAHRLPRMRQVVASDYRDNWQALGGGLYNYFTVCGGYSKYGMWGLTDLLSNLTTPKYLGIKDVIASFSTATGTTVTHATTASTGATTAKPTTSATSSSRSGTTASTTTTSSSNPTATSSTNPSATSSSSSTSSSGTTAPSSSATTTDSPSAAVTLGQSAPLISFLALLIAFFHFL